MKSAETAAGRASGAMVVLLALAAGHDGLRYALAILAVLVVAALFDAKRIPQTQPGRAGP